MLWDAMSALAEPYCNPHAALLPEPGALMINLTAPGVKWFDTCDRKQQTPSSWCDKRAEALRPELLLRRRACCLWFMKIRGLYSDTANS